MLSALRGQQGWRRVGFILPEGEVDMWGPAPKSCALLTSQNVGVWGPCSQCDRTNARHTPPWNPWQCQEGHTPRNITWDAMMTQVALPATSCTAPGCARPAPSHSARNAMETRPQ